jgi:hypothetical protein
VRRERQQPAGRHRECDVDGERRRDAEPDLYRPEPSAEHERREQRLIGQFGHERDHEHRGRDAEMEHWYLSGRHTLAR